MNIIFGRSGETMQKAYMTQAQASAGVNKWGREGWKAQDVKHGGKVTLADVLEYAEYLADPQGYLARTLAAVEA